MSHPHREKSYLHQTKKKKKDNQKEFNQQKVDKKNGWKGDHKERQWGFFETFETKYCIRRPI